MQMGCKGYTITSAHVLVDLCWVPPNMLAAITKEVVSFCNARFQNDFTLVVVVAAK